MSIYLKITTCGKNLLVFCIGICSLLSGFYFNEASAQDLSDKAAVLALAIQNEQNFKPVQNNGVLAVYKDTSKAQNPLEKIAEAVTLSKPSVGFSCKSEKPSAVVRKVNVVATAYSSVSWQTDDTPFITANNTYVHDGVIANNMLAFGTQIMIPELYGNKVFTVEDRMHWRKSNYQIDIWFPSYQQAVNFGAKPTYIEVLN